jgi:hypothetical protein
VGGEGRTERSTGCNDYSDILINSVKKCGNHFEMTIFNKNIDNSIIPDPGHGIIPLQFDQ